MRDENAPSPAELLEEELEPLPRWVSTRKSPLRVRAGQPEQGLPTYLVVCVQHPEWSTRGRRSWVVRQASEHAGHEHGVHVA